MTPLINHVAERMAVDKSAEVSIVSNVLWHRLRKISLQTAPTLRAFGGSQVFALGQVDFNVENKGRRHRLLLVFTNMNQERRLFGLSKI